MLLLLLVVGPGLRHSSERVRREMRVHVDGIVRAVLHVCGMFRQTSREYSMVCDLTLLVHVDDMQPRPTIRCDDSG